MTTLTWNQYPNRAPDPRWSDNWEDWAAEQVAHDRSQWRRRPEPTWENMTDEQKRYACWKGTHGAGAQLRAILKEINK